MPVKRIGALVCLCLLAAMPATAQRVNKPDFKPAKAFDRSGGEEYQIKQRELWFQQKRGLYDHNQAGQLRRDAVEQSRIMKFDESFRQRAEWTEVGPSPMNMLSWAMGRVAGRVSAIAVHPTDNDIIYLGAAGGGLWKTNNGGISWDCLSNDLGTQSIGSLWIDPSAPDTLWVGTGEHAQGCSGYFGQGLFKSTDGGATLVPMNGTGARTLDLSFIVALTAHPAEPDVILAAGHGYCDNGSTVPGGIFRSADGGLNWDKVLTGDGADLISDPSDPDVFYASLGRSSRASNGVYKSLDGGANWTRQENGVDFGTSIGRYRLAMAPSDSNILYAYNGSDGAIYKTTNGGTDWTRTTTGACGGQCWYNLCIAVNPTDPDTILVGSILFGKSTNSGPNLTNLTSGWGSSQTVHQDIQVLVYDRTDPNKFWVGSDGGIWRSDDGGNTFVNLNGNLNITQFYDIAVDPRDSTRIYGGAQDNSSLGTQNNLVWDVNIVTGDGFMNLVDPLDTNVVIQTSYPGSTPSLARSTSGGTPGTFNWLSMSGVTSGGFPWVTPLDITANTARTNSYMFVASRNVFMSENQGTTWRPLSPSDLASGSMSVIKAVPVSDRIVVYAGSSSGQIFRTTNALDANPVWREITNNYPGGWVSDIAVDSSNSDRVFVSRSGFGLSRLYLTNDGGVTWEAIGANLPNVPANSVAIDPIDPDRIYVGSDAGVFESLDGGNTFAAMMQGFPLGTVVNDLEVSEEPHLLTAGTYGRGAWQLDLTVGDLTVTAGPNLDSCLGDPVNLNASASNSVGTPSYTWSVLTGPNTSSTQFSNTSAAAPVFTPTAEGNYVLHCEVSDDLSRTAGASVELYVSSVETHTANQQDAWGSSQNLPAWEVRYDTNGDGRVDISDLLIQSVTPTCY